MLSIGLAVVLSFIVGCLCCSATFHWRSMCCGENSDYAWQERYADNKDSKAVDKKQKRSESKAADKGKDKDKDKRRKHKERRAAPKKPPMPPTEAGSSAAAEVTQRNRAAILSKDDSCISFSSSVFWIGRQVAFSLPTQPSFSSKFKIQPRIQTRSCP